MKFINLHSHNIGPSFHENMEIYTVYNQDVRAEIKPNQIYSLGWHPWWPAAEFDNFLSVIHEKAINDPNCIAIGECGLDKLTDTSLDLQIPIFKAQLALAIDLKLPLILHCVRAHSEITKIIGNYLPYSIFHGYDNKWSIAERLSEKSANFSFGKALFSNTSNASQIFIQIPSNQIFIETDNSDWGIEDIYERAAELRNISIFDLGEIVESNFERIFVDGRF